MKAKTGFCSAMKQRIDIPLAGSLLLLTGCGAVGTGTVASELPLRSEGGLTGHVHGGQQPVAGSHIYLYAVSTTGYGAAGSSLLTSDVLTDGGGSFNITGKYACAKGQHLYIVAMGGNPGAGTNNQAALMTALGDCGNINAQTFIEINEVTTVSSVYALAPFMKSASEIGTTPSNLQGLARAFDSVGKLVDISTGAAPGPALPLGASVSAAKINTLANVVASCVNSRGGLAGDGSNCGRLFTYASGLGFTPTDTVSAVLSLVRNPTANVAEIFNLIPGTRPFSPSLAVAPSDWSLAVTYTRGGFSSPSAAATDDKGNIWVTNATGNSVTILAQSGNPVRDLPLSGNGLAAPSAIAVDATGKAWVTNQQSGTVSAFTSQSVPLSGSPFLVGAGPTAVAVDPEGFVWVANTSEGSVTKLANDGTVVARITSQVASPTAVAINSK